MVGHRRRAGAVQEDRKQNVQLVAVGRRVGHECLSALLADADVLQMLPEDPVQRHLYGDVCRHNGLFETVIGERHEGAVQTATALVVGIVLGPRHRRLPLDVEHVFGADDGDAEHADGERRRTSRIRCIQVDDGYGLAGRVVYHAQQLGVRRYAFLAQVEAEHSADRKRVEDGRVLRSRGRRQRKAAER